MSTQSCGTSKSMSFMCELNESFFRKVATRTKQKQGNRNTLFHHIPEGDSLQADDESDGEPVFVKPTAVLSPTENAVNLDTTPQKLNLSAGNICENNNSKNTLESTFTVAGVDQTPTQTRETEVSIRENAKESPQIYHEILTVKSSMEEQEVLATTSKFVCVNSLETPPYLKQNAQGFSTITRRKNQNRTKFLLDHTKGKASAYSQASFLVGILLSHSSICYHFCKKHFEILLAV